MLYLATWKLILITLAILGALTVAHSLVAAGCKKLNEPVDILLVLCITLLIISAGVIGLFLIEMIIHMLMPFGNGGLIFIPS